MSLANESHHTDALLLEFLGHLGGDDAAPARRHHQGRVLFGAIEIPAWVYLERLDDALKYQGVFCPEVKAEDLTAVLDGICSGQAGMAPSGS